jgi:hypothetical protein
MDEDKAPQLAVHQAQRQQAGHKRGRGAACGRSNDKKKKVLTEKLSYGCRRTRR